MSNSNGRKRAALGLGVVAAIAVGAAFLVGSMVPLETLQPTKGEDASTYDPHYQTRRGACEPARLRALPLGVAGDDKRAECSRQEEDHRLGQQAVNQAARAAEAAEEGLQLGREQTRVAFVQAILSALAVVFTGWAAWAAARAALAAADGVDASQRSAKAAEDAVAKSDAILTHAQEATERQLRPYVYIVAPDEKRAITRNGTVRAVIKNFGQTPAKNILVQDYYRYVPRPVGDAAVDFLEPEAPIIDLGPTGEVMMTYDLSTISDAEFAGVKSGHGVLLVRIRVEYEVSKDMRDSEEVLLMLDKDGLKEGDLSLLSAYERQRPPQID